MHTLPSFSMTSDEAFELDSILTSRGYKAAITHACQRLHMPVMLAKQLVDNRTTLVHDGDNDRVVGPLDMTGNRSEVQIAASLLAFVGMGLLVVGLINWHFQHAIVDCGIEVDATVSSYKTTARGASPVFSYRWDGHILEYHSRLTSDPAAYELGAAARLFVDPEYPTQAVVDDFMHRWLFITVCGTLGVGLILVSGLLGLMGGPPLQ